jgi:hypothetical protein
MGEFKRKKRKNWKITPQWTIETSESADDGIVAWIAAPCANTMTVVKDVVSILDPIMRKTCVLVTHNPGMTVKEARQSVPKLAYASDAVVNKVIRDKASRPYREYSNEWIEDLARVNDRLKAKTVDYYRRHESRQVKSKNKGRPSQEGIAPTPHKHCTENRTKVYLRLQLQPERSMRMMQACDKDH